MISFNVNEFRSRKCFSFLDINDCKTLFMRDVNGEFYGEFNG